MFHWNGRYRPKNQRGNFIKKTKEQVGGDLVDWIDGFDIGLRSLERFDVLEQWFELFLHWRPVSLSSPGDIDSQILRFASGAVSLSPWRRWGVFPPAQLGIRWAIRLDWSPNRIVSAESNSDGLTTRWPVGSVWLRVTWHTTKTASPPCWAIIS